MTRRARILIVHPDLRPPGGGNTVAAWAIQALAACHDVTVLAWEPAPLDEVDRFYGSQLASCSFRWAHPPSAARRLRAALQRVPSPLVMLKSHLLARYAKRLAGAHDLLFSTENEMDLGGAGLQYIHFPAPRRPPRVGWRGLLLLPGAPLDLYYRLAFALSSYDPDAERANLTLVNSRWTGRRVAAILGIPSVTLYPPVAAGCDAGALPWERREDGFVALGRFAAEKRLELLVDIVAAVRARGRPVRLHLVGSRIRGERATAAVLRRAARLPWVELHEGLPRARVLELLGRNRYGLHGMRDEHFGIAIAEMVAAGCIPFVPDDGGQVEIVDRPELTFHDRDGAVARILAVLGDEARQRELRDHLAAAATRFDAARFGRELLAIVDGALSSSCSRPR